MSTGVFHSYHSLDKFSKRQTDDFFFSRKHALTFHLMKFQVLLSEKITKLFWYDLLTFKLSELKVGNIFNFKGLTTIIQSNKDQSFFR